MRGVTRCPSHIPLTLDMLSDQILAEEVTVYGVGRSAGGTVKSHLYVRNTIHIATCIELPEARHGDPSHGRDPTWQAGEHHRGVPR
jgi:hypothetical protein